MGRTRTRRTSGTTSTTSCSRSTRNTGRTRTSGTTRTSRTTRTTRWSRTRRTKGTSSSTTTTMPKYLSSEMRSNLPTILLPNKQEKEIDYLNKVVKLSTILFSFLKICSITHSDNVFLFYDYNHEIKI